MALREGIRILYENTVPAFDPRWGPQDEGFPRSLNASEIA